MKLKITKPKNNSYITNLEARIMQLEKLLGNLQDALSKTIANSNSGGNGASGANGTPGINGNLRLSATQILSEFAQNIAKANSRNR